MSAEVLIVTFAPVVALGALLAATAGRSPWTSERIGGFILIVFGVALLTIARSNLGNSFSVTTQATTWF